MTDSLYEIAYASVKIFSAISLIVLWSTLARWILQVFERMINVMDIGHFPDRTYD